MENEKVKFIRKNGRIIPIAQSKSRVVNQQGPSPNKRLTTGEKISATAAVGFAGLFKGHNTIVKDLIHGKYLNSQKFRTQKDANKFVGEMKKKYAASIGNSAITASTKPLVTDYTQLSFRRVMQPSHISVASKNEAVFLHELGHARMSKFPTSYNHKYLKHLRTTFRDSWWKRYKAEAEASIYAARKLKQQYGLPKAMTKLTPLALGQYSYSKPILGVAAGVSAAAFLASIFTNKRASSSK